VTKIHEFYETLQYNVESLQTLGKLDKLDAAVRFTVDKLALIKNELAMMNDNWSEWTFLEFVAAFDKWTRHNPVNNSSTKKLPKERGRSFARIFCDNETHKAINCDKVVKTEERKRILAAKHLCFNCAGSKHRAAECRSKTRRQEPGMTANHVGRSKVVHPVVVVRINGHKFRALLDRGASHSYASTTAIDLSGAKVKSTFVKLLC
jgi:hypothetical protein